VKGECFTEHRVIYRVKTVLKIYILLGETYMNFTQKIIIISIAAVIIGVIGAMLNILFFNIHPAIIAGITGGIAGGLSAGFMSFMSNNKKKVNE